MGTSRFSVPFFLHPKSSMSLACLDSCISSENPKAYQDITAGEYLDQRLREIGLKMGFRYVESGPLVRSSYHAEKHLKK